PGERRSAPSALWRGARVPFVLPARPLAPPAAADWPALVQAPHAQVRVKDLGLRPLLRTEGGRPITTRAGWEKAREALRAEWLRRLGPAPARPAALDARAGKAEDLDGYRRRLVRFRTEGDDFLPAWLPTP